MSDEISQYTQLLRDIADAIGANASTPEDRFGDFGPKIFRYHPDGRLRDEVMQRIGVLLDREHRLHLMERSEGFADTPEHDDFTWE